MSDATRERWVSAGWWAFWFCASAWWILAAAGELGATFDEPIDLQRALDFWRTGHHHELLRVGSMPLPMDVAAIPAFVYERWHGVTLDVNADLPPSVLFACRAIMLVFWAMLLYYAMRVGTDLSGPWGGRLAVAFLACEPNFLAHATLATKDIAMSAFLLPAVWHFGLGRDAGWARRILVPGLWYGGCMLAKASGMVFVPFGMLMLEVHRLASSGAFAKSTETSGLWSRFARPFGPFVRDMMRIGVIGLVVAFVYCGSAWRTEPSWIAWAQRLPEGRFRDVMVYLSENLAIFNNAGVGLVKQIGHNIRGHGAYLLGVTHPRALWYYFPVAIAIKMTLPLLLLPLVLLALDRRSLGNWACVLAAALFAYSVQCRVQIGIRLMLPWIAVGIVGLSAAAVRAWSEARGSWRRPALATYCCLGLLWNAQAAVAVWPHGLCYVNELWGGPREASRIISDSNFDWGQGIPELRRWLDERGQPPTYVWYFGTDPAVRTLPAERKQFHASDADAFLREVKGKFLAVNTTIAYGAYVLPSAAVNRVLRERVPVARTQTFLIYDFTRDDALASR